MGGDHKCPVCQATFTRPQHVARHMRSHTGDRPYKCQHCGDQFARSDLLSRHVNKCHSAEKDLGHPPLPGVAPGRRKGSSAATRATTSKQACDQCVQGSLPCDGSNPCAKCVSRKVRCTFVKFHRQTAPVGPGHPASLSASHPSSTSSGAGVSVLESNPSSSSASGLPLPTLLPGLALTQPHPALSANSPHSLHLAHPGEPAPFLYAQQAASGGGYHHQGEFDGRGAYEPQQQRRRDSEPYYPPPPGSAGSGGYYGGYRESFEGRDFDGRSIDSSDFDGRSERGSSVSGGGSRPQSSAGLPGGEYAPYLPNGRHHASASLDLHHHPEIHQQQQRGGEFSSAFGLMSLDDPNVLAGLATDGVPFFSHAVPPSHQHLPPLPPGGRPHSSHHPHAHGHAKLLPAPPALAYEPPSQAYGGGGGGALPTPGTSREAETRELREFWKAYMRTPLTGPGELGMQTPSANATGGQLDVSSPSGGRRLVRVASLPSVKTPESEFVPSYGGAGQGPAQPQRAGTMHNADDLRSYEAAVLARKAPELTLRKPVRRPGTSTGAGARSSSAAQQSQQSPQQQQHAPPPPQQQQQFDFGRESSASSLAGAFGPTGGGGGYGASTGSPHSPFPGPGTPSSGSGGASDGEDTGGSTSGGGARPNFKRLPSQTLGPAHAKRRPPPDMNMGMMTSMGGGSVGYAAPGVGLGADGERPSSVHGYSERPTIALRHPPHGQHGGHGHGHGHRGRRLSEPASPTAPGFVHV